MKRNRRKKPPRSAAEEWRLCCGGCLCCVVGFYIFIALMRWWLVWGLSREEIPLTLTQANKIVEAIQHGELKTQDDPTFEGPIEIKLPPHLDYGFKTHAVYVLHNKSGLTTITLPTLSARIVERCWIHVNRALTPEDTEPHEGALLLKVGYDYFSAGERYRALTKQIDTHWYQSYQQTDWK